MKAEKPTTKTYSQLRTDLDELLQWFESDDIDLDQAAQKYEQTLQAVKALEDYLKTAENKITKLKKDFSGSNS